MPRRERLDIPGLLQHVIVRGIEKRKIFLDDEDLEFFVKRFSKLLVETETDCLAWALMSKRYLGSGPISEHIIVKQDLS
jgi:hypothetical protein